MTMRGERSLRSHHASFIGGSHEKTGKVCQDYSSEYRYRDLAIATVADGHGSDRYVRSDKGSRFAVEISNSVISSYYSEGAFTDLIPGTDPTPLLDNVIRTIITRCNSIVNDDIASHPLSESEIEMTGDMSGRPIEKVYGTTLLVGVITVGFAFGLQIGDGAFTVHRGSTVDMPMPEDPECTGNKTSSICDISAFDKFRKWYSWDVPDAITVSTDGLYTTFITEDDFKSYCERMVDLCIRKNLSWDGVTVNLKKRAHSGHEDDLSVSLIGFSEY